MPAGKAGTGPRGETMCCAACLFNPLGCRCKYGEFGVLETFVPDIEDEDIDDDPGVCDRCGGEGWIDYLDGDGGDWGEDCPSEENHPITCRQCRGTGRMP